MFDKLWEIIAQAWTHLSPFMVVHQYELGVRTTLGKLSSGTLNPGLHLKIPIVDKIYTAIVTMDTLDIQPINITTSDNITITVGAVLEFEIVDIIKYIIDTNEARSNTHDITRGLIADYLVDCTYDECKKRTTNNAITKRVSKKCEEMGIKVNTLTFTDMAVTRAFKLYGNITN